jgi:hypothetical protein
VLEIGLRRKVWKSLERISSMRKIRSSEVHRVLLLLLSRSEAGLVQWMKMEFESLRDSFPKEHLLLSEIQSGQDYVYFTSVLEISCFRFLLSSPNAQ